MNDQNQASQEFMPIPRLRVEPNPKLESEFLARLNEKYGITRGDEIHTSDLTLCLRLSFFRRFMPKPLTPKTLMFFIDGESRGVVLQILFGEPSEVKGVDDLGVHYSLDMFDTVTENILELKSTRGNYPVESHDYWLRQIGLYMLQLNYDEAWLVVMWLNPKKDQSPFGFYRLTWEDEKAKISFNSWRVDTVHLVKELMVLHDIKEVARRIPKLPQYPDKFPCKECPYKQECGELG